MFSVVFDATFNVVFDTVFNALSNTAFNVLFDVVLSGVFNVSAHKQARPGSKLQKFNHVGISRTGFLHLNDRHTHCREVDEILD